MNDAIMSELMAWTVSGILTIPAQVWLAKRQDSNPDCHQPRRAFGHFVRYIPFLGIVSAIVRVTDGDDIFS